MEKHKCKLCFKTFANGRALGGHMRSHMLNLYVPPKSEQQQQRQTNREEDDRQLIQLGEEIESASSSSSEEEENNGMLGYGLRENPKKSIRLVDPEFSFNAGSVVLQDRESETESSRNPVRRRSKRIRRFAFSEQQCHDQNLVKKPETTKKPKTGKPDSISWVEPEPVSSISESSPEEDVAYCLMMLSRDKWMRDEGEEEDNDNNNNNNEKPESDYNSDDSDGFKYRKTSRVRGKYKCETCHRVFRSYQALGGHRASHKKSRLNGNGGISIHEPPPTMAETGNAGVHEEKIHECPVCFRVFSSGQALGGHKRSHVTGPAAAAAAAAAAINYPARPPSKFSESLIDLNLPAPVDDDDDEMSQMEFSVVSDAECVNPIDH